MWVIWVMSGCLLRMGNFPMCKIRKVDLVKARFNDGLMGGFGVENVFSLRIQVSDKEGISRIILFWWWDWNPQSYSREVSGFLGFCSSFCWWFRIPAFTSWARLVVEIPLFTGFFHTSQVVFDFPDFWTINSFSMGFLGQNEETSFSWEPEEVRKHVNIMTPGRHVDMLALPPHPGRQSPPGWFHF